MTCLHTMYNLTVLIYDCFLRTGEEKFLARNLQGPSHLLLPFRLPLTLLSAQLGLPLLPNVLARWRMLQRKMLDHQTALLKVPRR
jgi:hypothetical protein